MSGWRPSAIVVPPHHFNPPPPFVVIDFDQQDLISEIIFSCVLVYKLHKKLRKLRSTTTKLFYYGQL